MPEAVNIRPATFDDLDSLTGLIRDLSSIEEDFVQDGPRQRRGLEMMLNSGRGCILVADADGAVVGMCSGQLTVPTAEGGPAVLVEDLLVHQDWRGRGIGSALMDSIAAWAKGNNQARLQLLADRNTVPALEFYKSLDWQPTRLIRQRTGL